MRRAGFPCRVMDCDRSFRVEDQSSMESLTAASQARRDHEVAVHGYHHVTITEEPGKVWSRRVKPKSATGS